MCIEVYIGIEIIDIYMDLHVLYMRTYEYSMR